MNADDIQRSLLLFLLYLTCGFVGVPLFHLLYTGLRGLGRILRRPVTRHPYNNPLKRL